MAVDLHQPGNHRGPTQIHCLVGNILGQNFPEDTVFYLESTLVETKVGTIDSRVFVVHFI